MTLPVVVIVGRPNVGKSSLFNWLAGRRIAIVEPTAGVTRDRVATLVEAGERFFELVDTGGMGIQDADNLTALVERQIDMALEQASVIVLVVDARSGPTHLDEEVASRLRAVNKPVLCVVNKADTPELEGTVADFFRLGHGEPVAVSAQQKRGQDPLLRRLLKLLPCFGPAAAPKVIDLKLAIVGRRNTGKSTFINQLAQSERMIVSEVPGTTRDSVDVRFERDGKAFIAIDTAGVRRKRSVKSAIDFYSMGRAERTIRRADVVLLFLDATQKISQVDKKLAGYVLAQHKPVIFVVNKWDKMVPLVTGVFAAYLKKMFPMLDFVPLAFVTAKTGRNVHAVVNLAQHLHKQASKRVATPELNRVIRAAMEQQAPPLRQNRRAKVYYATQVAVQPPTIVLFTNDPELFSDTYQRYILKALRDHLPFTEVPIKLYLRSKAERGEGEGSEQPATASMKRARPEKKTGAGKKRKVESELWEDV